MIRRITVYTYLIFVLFQVLMAQEKEGEVRDAEFIIEKKKAVRLPQANRIFSPFDISVHVAPLNADLTMEEPEFTIPTFSPSIKNTFQESHEKKETYPNYARAAFGNLISPLIEYSYRSEGSTPYGIHLFHESFGRGPVRDENSAFNESQMSLWGMLEGRQTTVKADISYQRNGFYYYGLSDSIFNAPEADSVFFKEQAFRNNLRVGFSIEGRSANNKLNYSITPSWNYTDLVDFSLFSRENFVDISSELDLEVNNELTIYTDLSSSFISSDSDLTQTRSWLRFNPGIVLSKPYFSLRAGVILNNQTDDLFADHLLVAPDLKATFQLSNSSFVFARIDGSVDKNSLRRLSERNMFLTDSLRWTSTLNKFQIKAGWSGYQLDKLRTAADLTFRAADNQALYLNNPSDPSRFDVVYDSSFHQISLNVNGKYQFNDQWSLFTGHQVNIYDAGSEEEAWHLPIYRGETRLSGKFDRISASTTILMLSGMKSYSFDNEEVINISSIFDLGIDVSYSINPKGTVFLSLKNMLNQNNERYLNYPAIPLNFKIGGYYSF